MTKGALVMLTVAAILGLGGSSARAQAVAESAILHANSTAAAGVARALGGKIQESLSKTQSQFSYPPRASVSARARARRLKARAHPGPSPIAISSVIGGPAPCAVRSEPSSPQKSPAGAASIPCGSKAPVRAANAKSNPSEITVSF